MKYLLIVQVISKPHIGDVKGKKMKLDIIGDVHGKREELEQLLMNMGYKALSGIWRHPQGRKALFVGDLVDRGADVAGVLKLVKAMGDAGEAIVLLGNHEFNLLCWYTSDQMDNYLRPHTEKNAEVIIRSTEYFDRDPDAKEMYLEWFQRLPIRIEMNGARFVHAYWGQNEVDLLAERNSLKACGWGDPAFRKLPVGIAVELLIKGPEVRLPQGYHTIDRQGSKRKKARCAWWKDGRRHSLRDMIVPFTEQLPEIPYRDEIGELHEWYAPDQPPVFIGHYGFKEYPGLLSANVACVDYVQKGTKSIGAYRWNGGPLHKEAFVMAA